MEILPNIKSAKKRVKVAEAKTLQNKIVKNQLRTAVKKYDAAVASGNKDEAEKACKLATKKMDQAVGHGIVHKNAAAHKKSQFAKKLNSVK